MPPSAAEKQQAHKRDKALRDRTTLPCELGCGTTVPYYDFPANPFHPVVCDSCARAAMAHLEAQRAALGTATEGRTDALGRA
jgi:hypothetical protein